MGQSSSTSSAAPACTTSTSVRTESSEVRGGVSASVSTPQAAPAAGARRCAAGVQAGRRNHGALVGRGGRALRTCFYTVWQKDGLAVLGRVRRQGEVDCMLNQQCWFDTVCRVVSHSKPPCPPRRFFNIPFPLGLSCILPYLTHRGPGELIGAFYGSCFTTITIGIDIRIWIGIAIGIGIGMSERRRRR